MFFVIILLAMMGVVSFEGTISLLVNKRYRAGIFPFMGIVQIILMILLFILLGTELNNVSVGIISLILSLMGSANLITGYCDKWRINFILGISQPILFFNLI